MEQVRLGLINSFALSILHNLPGNAADGPQAAAAHAIVAVCMPCGVMFMMQFLLLLEHFQESCVKSNHIIIKMSMLCIVPSCAQR